MSLIKLEKKTKSLTIKAKTDNTAEILLYGAIGESGWDDSISAKEFSDELKKLPDSIKNITLRINSPGGDVFDGIAIYERLKQHKAKVTVYIDGLAASIASVIAMAADEIIIGEGAMMMIHKPWTMAIGNSSDLERTIELLDKIENQMIGIYSRKTNLSYTEISKMLSQDTWFTSAEALDLGFANSVSNSQSQLSIAASFLEKAAWFDKNTRPTIDTHTKEIKNKIGTLQETISGFLAR